MHREQHDARDHAGEARADQKPGKGEAEKPGRARQHQRAEQRQHRHGGDGPASAEAIESQASRQLHDCGCEHHRADHDADLGSAEAKAAIELERHHPARGAMQLCDREQRAGNGQDP